MSVFLTNRRRKRGSLLALAASALRFFCFWGVYCLPVEAAAQIPDAPPTLPTALRLWIERSETALEAKDGKTYRARDMSVIDLQSSDLNGDGAPDYLLALEQPQALSDDAECLKRRKQDATLRCGVRRYLLALVSRSDGSVECAATSANALLCSDCGGVMGDPYAGIKAGFKTFTVSHYGGSAEKWGAEAQFSYSNRDKTWQLVRVTTTLTRPAKNDELATKERQFAPPRDYGKINFSDFDPDNYLGKGEGYKPRRKK